MVSFNDRVVGSSLLCQEFAKAKGNPLPQYFQPRPSAAGQGDVGMLALLVPVITARPVCTVRPWA